MTFEEWESKTIAFAGESPNAYARRAFNAALKLAAGASEGQAEPVAWITEDRGLTISEVQRAALVEHGGQYASKARKYSVPLYTHPSAEIAALRERIAGLEAARIAYASEFHLDEDGLPDVGSIHQNIRELKKRIAGMEKDAERYRYVATLQDWGDIERMCWSSMADSAEQFKSDLDSYIDAAIAKEPK